MLGLYAFGSVPYSTRPPETRLGEAHITSDADMAVLSSEVLQGSTGRVQATATVNAVATRVRTPIGASVFGSGFAVSAAIRSPANLSTRLSGIANMNADSYRKGQEWSPVTAGNETWTHIPNP